LSIQNVFLAYSHSLSGFMELIQNKIIIMLSWVAIDHDIIEIFAEFFKNCFPLILERLRMHIENFSFSRFLQKSIMEKICWWLIIDSNNVSKYDLLSHLSLEKFWKLKDSSLSESPVDRDYCWFGYVFGWHNVEVCWWNYWEKNFNRNELTAPKREERFNLEEEDFEYVFQNQKQINI
jgi:hypothetical protein